MTSAYQFDLEIRVDGHDLRVTGSACPYRPATGPTMAHAGGDPAEGGEIDDIEAYMLYGTKERLLPEAMVARLDLADKIHEAIADGADDYEDE